MDTRFPIDLHIYLDAETDRRLRALADAWGEGMSATVRRAIRDSAKREKVE